MAIFGLRYFAQLRSKYKGVFWRVEIAERDYNGPSEEMELAGGSPLGITLENRGDEFYVPVKASEATINVMCHDCLHYLTLNIASCKCIVDIQRSNSRHRIAIFKTRFAMQRPYEHNL